ncbi:peroxynitrite isomerase THAP4-like [Ornithodoros turicata]|uniref:peroxynitrite isomerase THAP4-like n=1 Tax=Ornithodoros turicata TaxID=34597 RepID=UPI0031388900
MPSHNNCCIVGCNATYANSTGIRLYSFPWKTYEKDRRATWIQLVRRETSTGKLWEPTKHSRICGKHFVGNVKSDEERHPAYNPSIFPDVYRKRSTPSSDRYARANRRRECGAVSTQSSEPTGEDEGGDHNEFSSSTMTEESSGSSSISAFYCEHYDTSVAVQVSSVSVVDGIS